MPVLTKKPWMRKKLSPKMVEYLKDPKKYFEKNPTDPSMMALRTVGMKLEPDIGIITKSTRNPLTGTYRGKVWRLKGPEGREGATRELFQIDQGKRWPFRKRLPKGAQPRFGTASFDEKTLEPINRTGILVPKRKKPK